MILNKEDLRRYLKEDKRALHISKKRPQVIGDEIWKFEIALRKYEYYTNCKNIFNVLYLHFWHIIYHRYSLLLGFSIPINVFEEGLRINHYGLIVVNPKAKIGKNCDIHQGVNIGQNIGQDTVPYIGDNVWIGPGVKLFGEITLGNNIMIGANSVVNKSFVEDGIVIAGIPAQKVKTR